jgi:hypothetical protein
MRPPVRARARAEGQYSFPSVTVFSIDVGYHIVRLNG